MHKYWRENLQYLLPSRDPAAKERFEGRVVWETDNRLTLTRPFYELLPEFESSGKSFDQFLPTLLEHLPEYGRQRHKASGRIRNAINELVFAASYGYGTTAFLRRKHLFPSARLRINGACRR